MRTFRTSLTAIAVAILAVACGGGGDGGGDVSPPPPTSVLISAENQDAVARASLASIMPFLSVPLPPAATQPSATAPRGGLSPLALLSVKASTQRTMSTPAGMARALAEYQRIYYCKISGSLTIVVDDKDNNRTLSAGDSMSLTFNQCDDDVGAIINGSMGMAIASYSLTPTAEDATGAMTFQSLMALDSSGSYSMDGGVAFQISETRTTEGTNLFGRFTVASGGLIVSKQGGTGGLSDSFSYRAEYTVTDRDFTSSVPGIASWEEISASGTFRSATLAGDLTLTTTTPFRSSYTDPTGDIFPTEGQLIATGRDNTKVGLTATETVNVRADMCDDGDNAWESSKMVPWDWLLQ